MFLDEAQPADWSTTEVLDQINDAYHFVVSKVVEVYEEYYLTTTPLTYSTVANQQQYALSATFLKIERVEINITPVSTPTADPQRATAIKMEEIPLSLNSSILNGSPYFNVGYYIAGPQSAQYIGFVPVPAETGTDNISVWGIVAPADLSAAADPVLIPYPDNFAQIIAKIAAGNLLKSGQQEVNAGNDLLNSAMADVLNMQTFIKERQSDGPVMVVEAAWDDVSVSSGGLY